LSISFFLCIKSVKMELYVKTRIEWRKWLEKNHDTIGEVWLIYYKKLSGKPRILYSDAVEEALCFGWIDGKIKRINDEYYIQRFTPRRPGSRWSKYNIQRVQKMIELGQMKQSGLDAYNKVLQNPELAYDNKNDGIPQIPEDLMIALAADKSAIDNFQNFPVSSRRIYAEWLASAKRAETRLRRIEKIVELSRKNIRPGMN